MKRLLLILAAALAVASYVFSAPGATGAPLDWQAAWGGGSPWWLSGASRFERAAVALPVVAAAVAVLCLLQRRWPRLPLLGCPVFVAVAVGWALDARRAAAPETQAWLDAHAPDELALVAGAPRPSLNRLYQQAQDLIFGAEREEESILWLQALGVSHLVSADDAKYASLLDSEYEDARGFRVYRTPLRRASAAVVVSRRQWKRLPPIRSLRDRHALAAYVDWANRPEGARLRWLSGSSAELDADLGPDEMVLVRQNLGPGWSASLDGTRLDCLRDPLGFLLLDPAREGSVTIRLAPPRQAALWWRGPAALPDVVMPAVRPGGVVESLRHAPPPFVPGAFITIYGANLNVGKPVAVRVGGHSIQVLFASDDQVNARLPAGLPPGTAELVVDAGGVESHAVTVEIAPR